MPWSLHMLVVTIYYFVRSKYICNPIPHVTWVCLLLRICLDIQNKIVLETIAGPLTRSIVRITFLGNIFRAQLFSMMPKLDILVLHAFQIQKHQRE